MKIKELIEKLKELDQELNIMIKETDHDSSWFDELAIGKNEKDEPDDKEFYYVY